MLPLFMFFHLQLPYYICVFLASPNGSRYPHDISIDEVKRRNSSKANLKNPSRANVLASEYPHYSVANEGFVAFPFGSKEYRHAKVFKYPKLGGQKQAYASPNTPRVPSMVPKQPLACNEVVLGCCAENIDIMGLKGCALSFYHGENIPGLKVLLDQLTKCQPDKEMYRRCALEMMLKIAKENWKLVKLDPFLQNDKIVEDLYVLTISHAFDLLSYTKLIDVLTKINVKNKYFVNDGGHMDDHNLHGAFDGNVCFVLKMKDAENYAIFKHTYYLALYYMLKSNFKYQQPGEDLSKYKFRNTITEGDDFDEDFRIIHYVEDDVRSLYGKFELFEYIYIGLNGVNEILVFGLLAGTNLKDIVLVPHGLMHEDKAILTEIFMYIYNFEGTLVGFISHCGDFSGDLIHQLY